MIDEDRKALLDQCLAHFTGRVEPLLKQGPRPMPDHPAHAVRRHGRSAQLRQRVIERACQIGCRVGKRAVEIERDDVEGKIGHARPLAAPSPHGK